MGEVADSSASARSVVLGWSSYAASGNTAIAIGYNAHVSTSNKCLIGGHDGVNGGITSLQVGNQETHASPKSVTFELTHGTGTDIAAGDLTILAGKSTGNADPGDIFFQTSTAGGSGTTLQTASTRMSINGEGYISMVGQVVYTPTGDQSLLAATQISPNATAVRVVGNGGAVTLTGTPTIDDTGPSLADGQTLVIQGTDDTNTVKLQDEAQLANTDLQLAGATDMTLGKGDTIYLIYDSGDGKWYEISRSDN
jgi:hypothetical protein